jgi:hypothetical protein
MRVIKKNVRDSLSIQKKSFFNKVIFILFKECTQLEIVG